MGRWIKIWRLGSAQAVRAALGVASGERSGSVGAGGEQTAAGARRRFAITRFRLGSTRVLHGEVERDARNAIAASTWWIGGGEAALWRAAAEQRRRARACAPRRPCRRVRHQDSEASPGSARGRGRPDGRVPRVSDRGKKGEGKKGSESSLATLRNSEAVNLSRRRHGVYGEMATTREKEDTTMKRTTS